MGHRIVNNLQKQIIQNYVDNLKSKMMEFSEVNRGDQVDNLSDQLACISHHCITGRKYVVVDFDASVIVKGDYICPHCISRSKEVKSAVKSLLYKCTDHRGSPIEIYQCESCSFNCGIHLPTNSVQYDGYKCTD